ncbi:MAG: hypothetical protein NUW00_01780 [Candidatus Kaiserbacteria bacterium]|nr:hypothetical protein [Candidatus Kaiserbacteria bacterium]
MEKYPRYNLFNAQDEAEEMKNHLKTGDAKDYAEAERIIRINYLNEALNEIVRSHHLGNAIYYLEKAGEFDLMEKLITAELKESIDTIREDSKDIEINYNQEIDKLVGHLYHTPYNQYMAYKNRMSTGTSILTERPYIPAIAKLLAKVFEISGKSLFNAAYLYEDLEQQDKSKFLLNIARDRQAKKIVCKEIECINNLINAKSEFINAINEFFQEIQDDPAVLVSADQIIEEVRSKIEQEITKK